MRKHRSFFKAFLLLTTISTAVPNISYGAEMMQTENFYERGRRLLGSSVTLSGSYLKHQATSIGLQERTRQAESRWRGAIEGEDAEERHQRIAEAEEKVAKYADLVEQVRLLRERMPKPQRAARVQELQEHIGALDESLQDLESGGRGSEKRQIEIRKTKGDLSKSRRELDLLQKAEVKQNVYMNKYEEAQEELDLLQQEEQNGSMAFQEDFLALLYAKLKTINPVQNGKKKLATTNAAFLASLDEKYPLGEGYATERSYYESGTIVSPYKDMVELLHEIGVGPDLIKGLARGQEDGGPEVLDLPNLLIRLLAAIEVPNPRFEATDLPNPYYSRVGGQYSKKTAPIEKLLEAYAAMTDHIARVFELRLREDVASLRTIIESKAHFSLSRSSEIFSEVWNEEEGSDVGSFLKLKNKTKPQEVFQGIVQKYDSSFPQIPKEYLDAAIAPNPLGMLYRLLRATERDIHSWNPTDESDLDARIKTGSDIPRCFEDAVERIISRHYNKILLERMADKVRAVVTQSAPASLAPKQTSKSAVSAAAKAPTEVVVVAAPAPPAPPPAPVAQEDDWGW